MRLNDTTGETITNATAQADRDFVIDREWYTIGAWR